MENTMNTIDWTDEELHHQLWDAIDNIDKEIERLNNKRQELLKNYLLNNKGV